MSDRMKARGKTTKMKQQRWLEAEKSFRKIQEEIAPFIKKRRIVEHSTVGEWCETTSLDL